LKHRLLYIPIAFLFLLSFVDCAKKGTPGGGLRDTIPPRIVKSSPENYSIHFSGSEIEIRFDEYIKLKELSKELIISPPMKYTPIITPLSTSKTLKIKLLDTLKPNTTYSFNFGNSIVDNNEENKFAYFKYVFSTGSYIDSLKLSGRVRDALLPTPEIPTTVMLYEVNETYKDSIIYSEKPTYITVTQDTTGFFELTNLKEGEYLLLALKEKNNDYIFRPKDDKIGFVKETVKLPTDSTYNLTLFKEVPSYKLARPSQVGRNHIVFGYEGEADSLDFEVLSEVPPDYSSVHFRDEVKDSIHYWFKPAIKTDTLIFKVSHASQIDTSVVRMRELFADSLIITPTRTGAMKLKDTLKLRASVPLISFDAEKMQIMAKDSSVVEGAIHLNKTFNLAEISFPKTEEQSYKIQLFPGALTDFFGRINDTLQVNVSTRAHSDYGTLDLSLVNVARFPILVQLVDNKFNMVAEDYLVEDRKVYFDEIQPAKYYLRIIYDDNKNRRWDAGNFLQREQPERIIYYPTLIDVRANWSLIETFVLK